MGKASGAQVGTPPAGAAKRRLGAVFWWGGLGGSAMIIISPGTVILLTALMLPVLAVALLPEDGAGGRMTLTTLLFGLAASMHGLFSFWQGGAGFSGAVAALRQPSLLLTAWTAILGGWFVSEFSALTLRLLAEAKAASERRAMTARIAALEDEWGPLPSASQAAVTP